MRSFYEFEGENALQVAFFFKILLCLLHLFNKRSMKNVVFRVTEEKKTLSQLCHFLSGEFQTPSLSPAFLFPSYFFHTDILYIGFLIESILMVFRLENRTI